MSKQLSDMISPTPPFVKAAELYKNNMFNDLPGPQEPHTACLPGYPRIKMDESQKLAKFLYRDLNLKDLEIMSERLWMMSKQDSKNISPLHRQRVKSRDVVVTEDPRLHLVWHYDRIFIKPIPKYLLSFDFWQNHLAPTSPSSDTKEIYRAALGYLRTYFYLIQYESDFRLAQHESLCLIPKETTWESWNAFSFDFDNILDSDVSKRYSHGEIRLTRLNFYCKIFLRKRYFHYIGGQYETYFARYYGPILFVFAMLSVLLAALQLEMAVEQQYTTSGQWVTMWAICRWCSIVCLIIFVVISAWLTFILMYKITKEWIVAVKDRRKIKNMEHP